MSNRTAMISKIHIAKKDLAMKEDSYRDMLERKTGKRSASELSLGQLDTVLAEFTRIGWKPTKRCIGTSKEAQIRMIFAVWKDICPLLGVEDDEAAKAQLRAFVVRQTRTKANPKGISAAEFLDSTSANKVLEGLKSWRTSLRRKAAQAEAA